MKFPGPTRQQKTHRPRRQPVRSTSVERPEFGCATVGGSGPVRDSWLQQGRRCPLSVARALSLRVRRIGHRYAQTIKQECGESAVLVARNEWERDIGGKRPDLDAVRDTALEPLLSKKLRRGLKPLFETRVRRTVYPIHSGDSEVAFSIDRGKVEAGQQSSPLCEVE
jgi:CYTH domain